MASKTNRLHKFALLKDFVKTLKRKVEAAQAPNSRVLTNCLRDVNEAAKEARSAHVIYVSDERLSDEEKEAAENEWDAAQDEFGDLAAKAEEMLENLSGVDKPATISEADKTKIEEERVKSCEENLKEKTKQNDSCVFL